MDKKFEQYKYCIMKISPRLTKDDIEEIIELNEWDLLITLKNGEQYIYELDSNYHRIARYVNIEEITEEQERRELARRLQLLMDRNFMTQEELAERAGLTQAMISRYVSGRSVPNILTGRKIAKALGCTTDDFFRHDEYNKYLEDKK